MAGRRGVLVRIVGRLRERARRNVDLWESLLSANQPWRDHGPLRWRETRGTWVLDGATSPESQREGGRTDKAAGAVPRGSANTAESATRTHRAR